MSRQRATRCAARLLSRVRAASDAGRPAVALRDVWRPLAPWHAEAAQALVAAGWIVAVAPVRQPNGEYVPTTYVPGRADGDPRPTVATPEEKSTQAALFSAPTC